MPMESSILAAVLSAGITGGLSLIGVIVSNRKAGDRMQAQLAQQQAVTDTKLEELTREVRAHNNFAQRVPVLEEKVKVANHRLDDLENQLLISSAGKQYRLGDKVRIEVLQVNIAEASIDFIMAGENDGVREHIRQQLLSKQSHSSAYGQKRSEVYAGSKKKKEKDGKGAKNKQPGRRSGKCAKDKTSKKRRKKR